MNIGKAIKEIRTLRKISQGDLATLVGMKQASLSFIENNHTIPHKANLHKIAQALQVALPVIYILAITQNDAPKKQRDAYKQNWPHVKKEFLNIFLTDPENFE